MPPGSILPCSALSCLYFACCQHCERARAMVLNDPDASENPGDTCTAAQGRRSRSTRAAFSRSAVHPDHCPGEWSRSTGNLRQRVRRLVRCAGQLQLCSALECCALHGLATYTAYSA